MERGKNECERDIWVKEVKRDGTTSGITEESRRVFFVEGRVFLKGELKYEREKKMSVEQTRGSQGSWS